MFDWPSEWLPSSDISSSPDRTIILFFYSKLPKRPPVRALGVKARNPLGKPEVLDGSNSPNSTILLTSKTA